MKKDLSTYIGVLSCCVALSAPHAADAKGLIKEMPLYETESMVLDNPQGGSIDTNPLNEDKAEPYIFYFTEDISWDSFH